MIAPITLEKNTAEFEVRKQQLELDKLQKENHKLSLEQEKLELEKMEIQRPWFKKPAWWSAFIPLFIGAGTIYVAFSTGIINVEQLKKEKSMLRDSIQVQQSELQNLERQKESVTRTLYFLHHQQKKIDSFMKHTYTPIFIDNFFTLIENDHPELQALARDKAAYRSLTTDFKEAWRASFDAVTDKKKSLIDSLYERVIPQKTGAVIGK